MVKKKRIVSKLILALVVLTAISCCFLGSTFARYTSGGTGSATVDVAKWDVQFGAETETPVELGMISPAETAYNAGTHSDTPRKNEGEKVLVATITNNSDVEADVTIDIGEISFGAFDQFGDTAWAESSIEGAPTKEQVAALFSVRLWYGGEGALAAEAAEANTEITDGEPVTLGVGSETLKIYAQVTWTSADTTLKGDSDALDTWVGTHIETLTSTLTFTAVQGSQT